MPKETVLSEKTISETGPNRQATKGIMLRAKNILSCFRPRHRFENEASVSQDALDTPYSIVISKGCQLQEKTENKRKETQQLLPRIVDERSVDHGINISLMMPASEPSPTGLSSSDDYHQQGLSTDQRQCFQRRVSSCGTTFAFSATMTPSCRKCDGPHSCPCDVDLAGGVPRRTSRFAGYSSSNMVSSSTLSTSMITFLGSIVNMKESPNAKDFEEMKIAAVRLLELYSQTGSGEYNLFEMENADGFLNKESSPAFRQYVRQEAIANNFGDDESFESKGSVENNNFGMSRISFNSQISSTSLGRRLRTIHPSSTSSPNIMNYQASGASLLRTAPRKSRSVLSIIGGPPTKNEMTSEESSLEKSGTETTLNWQLDAESADSFSKSAAERDYEDSAPKAAAPVSTSSRCNSIASRGRRRVASRTSPGLLTTADVDRNAFEHEQRTIPDLYAVQECSINNLTCQPIIDKFESRVVTTRKTELAFVKPSRDGHYSRMTLLPSDSHLSGSALIDRRKVDIFLLQNAGDLKVTSTLALDRLTHGWPLTTICLWIFRAHDVFATMEIEERKMSNFLKVIEGGYRSDNPYHNRAHAADVTMRMYSLLRHGLNLPVMEKKDCCQVLLSCILAAAVHDYMHPGSNNQFQAEMSSEVAKMYNYRSPLEHFSASCALALADEIGLFSGMSKKASKQTRLEIIDLVLATDMSNHFDTVTSFGAILAAKHAGSTLSAWEGVDKASAEPSNLQAPEMVDFMSEKYETRMMILKIAMKLSDLGHCYLSWEEHMAWCERLEVEFFAQGDAESEASLDLSPLMDRRRPGVSNHANSVGFFQTFVIPMLEPWVEMFPCCMPILSQARANLEEHRNQALSMK